MSSDVKLREEMERLARPLDERPEDLDALLSDVAGRARSRRLKRRTGMGAALVLVAALAVWIAPSISDALRADPLPPVDAPEVTLDPLIARIAGTYTTDIHVESPTARRYRINGRWEMSLTAEGAVALAPTSGYRDIFGLPGPATFEIRDGDFVSAILAHESMGCIGAGRYRVQQIGDGLRFETIEDSCPWRSDILSSGTWGRS